MNITRSQQGPITILSLQGSIVSQDVGDMKSVIDECVAHGQTKLILELAQVPFVDGEGLEAIQDAVTVLGKRGGDLKVCTLNDVCRDIFSSTRMNGFVQVCENRDDATKSML
jgi:anti-anti-sigma factor